MAKVLMIIAQVDFQPVEYNDTKNVLESEGNQVVTASLAKETAVGKDGSEVMPDVAVDDVSSEEYDAVVVIGGPGAPVLGKYDSVIALLKSFKDEGKVVAAICIAPTILALAGVLDGKKATVWNKDEMQEKILHKYGAEFLDEPVVVDGNVVTGNGPDAAKDFGKAVADVIQGNKGE